MRSAIHILPYAILVLLLGSCSAPGTLSSYDDVYYSPKDDAAYASTDDGYVDIDDRAIAEEEEKVAQAQEQDQDDYYTPGYRESNFDRDEYSRAQAERNRGYYEDDDYYYSSRFRRFNHFNSGFNYYDPYYDYYSWNSYNTQFWRPTPYRPFYHRPGWGFSWNNHFGWTMSMNIGWGNYYPFGGYAAYNPWSYYGNVYCPPFATGGYYSNDFYYTRTPVYSGQYNSLGSYSSSTSASLRKANSSSLYNSVESKPASSVVGQDGAAVRNAPADARPVSSASGSQQKPAERPVSIKPEDRPNGVRPVEPTDQFKPREERPAQSGTDKPAERPAHNDYYRPTEDNGSNTGRPVDRDTYQREDRPTRTEPQRQDRPTRTEPQRNNRPTYTPPQRRTPTRSSGSEIRRSSPSRSSGTRSSSPSRTSPSKRR